MEHYEEARSIRRKTKKEGKSELSDAEKRNSEKLRVEKELEEAITAEKIAETEVQNFNQKISEIKRQIRSTLYDSDLKVEEKARTIAGYRKSQENCEYVVKQATAKWARLTNKREALERELADIISGK